MAKIKLFGVSPRNGIKYDTFATSVIINESSKDSIRKALEKKYKREFFLYTSHVDSKFKLSNHPPLSFMAGVLMQDDAARLLQSHKPSKPRQIDPIQFAQFNK